MIGFFTLLFGGNWTRLIPWAAGALAILGAYLYVHSKTATIEALQAKLAQEAINTTTAETAAKSSASALNAAQKQYAADLAAADKHYKALQAMYAATNNLLEAINNAPESENGPVAPVLAHTLDCLRDKAGSASGAGCAFRQGNATGGAAGLPAKP